MVFIQPEAAQQQEDIKGKRQLLWLVMAAAVVKDFLAKSLVVENCCFVLYSPWKSIIATTKTTTTTTMMTKLDF